MMYTEKMVEWLEEAQREDNMRAMEFRNSVLTRNGTGSESLHVLHSSGQDDETVTIQRNLMNQPQHNLNITI